MSRIYRYTDDFFFCLLLSSRRRKSIRNRFDERLIYIQTYNHAPNKRTKMFVFDHFDRILMTSFIYFALKLLCYFARGHIF